MPLRPQSLALTTDLYELTMSAAYFKRGLVSEATFELFVRELPVNRGYLVACGLEQALEYLEGLRFTDQDIAYLQGLPVFSAIPDGFWSYLSDLRFTGDVEAIPEGTPVMAEEPLLVVTAPLIEAQLVETYLLSMINFQTLIATKAARVVDAAQGRGIADFGLRRAHGPEAGFWAARASYVGGCIGTSNVEAARRLGIRPIGTAAHSFTMAFDDEMAAFEAYVDAYPDHSILLVDTYDTLDGVRRAATFGNKLKGVRLDSGDLAELATQARRILDEAGCTEATIVASGDLNEYKIADLVERGAPVDLFGVGTQLVTSYDAPALGGVYKLVSIGEEPRAKHSTGKATLPGKKQVVRFQDATGTYTHDLIQRSTEPVPGGAEALLVPVMRSGGRRAPSPSLDEIRSRATDRRMRLPGGVRRLRNPDLYEVGMSAALRELSRNVRNRRR